MNRSSTTALLAALVLTVCALPSVADAEATKPSSPPIAHLLGWRVGGKSFFSRAVRRRPHRVHALSELLAGHAPVVGTGRSFHLRGDPSELVSILAPPRRPCARGPNRVELFEVTPAGHLLRMRSG